MSVQARALESLLEPECAMRLRDTAHSSLTLWGQELSERYNLFDGLALGYDQTPDEQESAKSVNTAIAGAM
jgi:hypothetical protein